MGGDVTREGNAGSPGSGGASPYLSTAFQVASPYDVTPQIPGSVNDSKDEL